MKISQTKSFQVKEFLQSIKKQKLETPPGTDRFITLGVLISFFLVFSQALFLLLVYRSLPNELPLFYSKPYGEEQLGGRIALWILPLFSILIFLFNTILVRRTNFPSSLKRMLILISMCVSLFFMITEFKIITS